jgi:acetyl-CoA decarbonylase/synthase complex subunit alpha
MPDDIHLFVRNNADIPITMKSDIIKILEEKDWKEIPIPDPTLLERMIRKRRE